MSDETFSGRISLGVREQLAAMLPTTEIKSRAMTRWLRPLPGDQFEALFDHVARRCKRLGRVY